MDGWGRPHAPGQGQPGATLHLPERMIPSLVLLTVRKEYGTCAAYTTGYSKKNSYPAGKNGRFPPVFPESRLPE